MKKIILVFTILISGIVSAQKVNLTVELSGFKNNDGKAHVGLYNAEGKFLKEAYQGEISALKGLKAAAVFNNLAVGEYAVSVFHDENNSGILERGTFGIPKEDVACSNNAKAFMGPPKYSDAKFMLSKDKTISITLNN
ncbi:DUF2141 domain-containing protein [Flavobacterium cellulosilyticum]|uniref:DUF2141 domain-containing protein n=1 Tax=Flavobacterium cellulosilyticum TaxID=2541731 RepID=A0A4R5CHQ2_9FLAO|nr:DUF2141 domain-containing protein [Flavobacterium cellulosilyticum]TDD98619.1 DUF2141 domain-containing protein [Flavobacterium cellulosilyticum]